MRPALRKETVNFETFNNSILVHNNIMLDVLYNVVYCTCNVLFSALHVFVSVQIQCLLITNCNFLQKLLDFL